MISKRAALLGLLLLAGLRAQTQDPGERVEVRVLSTGANATVVIDRGSSDGLAAGDPVLFRPRAGGEYRGSVARLTDREATVELHDRAFQPPPGTRGEVFVPASRQRKPAPTPAPAPVVPPPDKGQRPAWQNKDEAFTRDKPLLAQVKPIDPKDRRSQLGGRFFAYADLNFTNVDDFANSIVRTGVETWLDNPFQRGGALRFDGEVNYRTEDGGRDGGDITVRELSYHEGGTRFQPTRWQVGRFLPADVPQLGLLDGVAWSRRRENGDAFGASVGFLPEMNEDMETGEDLQFGGFYRWVDDVRETVAVTAAVQKTFHQGKADRDLVVLDARRLPVDGWDLRASVWVDLYMGGNRDAVKGKGLELTQAFASAGRRFESGSGYELAYRRLRFPLLLRDNPGPVIADEIRNDRYDRLALTGWTFMGEKRHRVHGQLAAFDDETTDGASLELGIDRQGALFENGHLDLTGFGNAGRYGSSFGGRVTVGRTTENGQWDVMYDVAMHHFDGFSADRDDLLQHRLYASRSYDLDPYWYLTVHAAAHFWDTDTAWSAGFYLQRSF